MRVINVALDLLDSALEPCVHKMFAGRGFNLGTQGGCPGFFHDQAQQRAFGQEPHLTSVDDGDRLREEVCAEGVRKPLHQFFTKQCVSSASQPSAVPTRNEHGTPAGRIDSDPRVSAISARQSIRQVIGIHEVCDGISSSMPGVDESLSGQPPSVGLTDIHEACESCGGREG